jgi:hypothetical protein
MDEFGKLKIISYILNMDKYIDVDDEKQCTSCDVTKPISEFYKRKSGYINRICKECYNGWRDNLYEDKFFDKSHRVRPTPGQFINELQKKSTFDILIALDWSYNEEKNIWYRLPKKDQDGNWHGLIPFIDEKPKRSRKDNPGRKWAPPPEKPENYVAYFNMRKKQNSKTDEELQEIRERYVREKLKLSEIASIYGISLNYAHRIIKWLV